MDLLLVWELGPLDLSVADAFFVSRRAVNDNVFFAVSVTFIAFLGAEDLGEPVQNRAACRLRGCAAIVS